MKRGRPRKERAHVDWREVRFGDAGVEAPEDADPDDPEQGCAEGEGEGVCEGERQGCRR